MKLFEQLKQFRDWELRQQVAIIGPIVAVILALGVIYVTASKTTYTQVATGLAAQDTGRVTTALDEKAIPNRIGTGGASVEVPTEDLDRARIALAEKGTLGSGGAGGPHVGFELFDKTKLGTSDFQQGVQYQRALEGEIARTLEQVEGIESAQVTLVLPKDQLFTEEGTSSSASVLVTTSQGLESAQIKGVSRLVQSAVEGLKAQAITITDQQGQLLWPTAEGAAEASGGGAGKQLSETKMQNQISQRINAILASTLGPGKAQAQVTVDLNVDKTSVEKLSYGKKQVTVEEDTQDEQLRGAGGSTAGAGTPTNIPTYGTAGAGADTRYDNEANKRKYSHDKTVTRTEVAPGTVNRLDVALLVDKTVPAADVTALQAAVSRAAGLQEQRGDQIAVSRITFQAAKPQVIEKPTGPVATATKYLPAALTGLACLIFLFFARRSLRRRENEKLSDAPIWVSELERKAEELARRQAEIPETVDAIDRMKGKSAQQVEQMVMDDPQQIAEHVKFLVHSDE